MPNRPPPRDLPFKAGPYECYHFLGGNLAEVYLARDVRTGFTRAVKIMGSGYAEDSELMQRFIAEGNAARNCSHPNIVTTYEAGEADGFAYIAMEHLEGETLKVLLERGRIRSIPERINIAWQVAHGLAYLHDEQHMIHRDLKPENIHIDPLGHAKIFDFGVAKVKAAQPGQQPITKEGQLLGTPLYMSPEQVRGDAATFAADIYSYGVVLFVMFTGAFPFRAVSREDLYAAIVFYAPDLSPLEGKGIPTQIVQLITLCLDKQPVARPASFAEIERILRPLAQPQAIAAPVVEIAPPPPPPSTPVHQSKRAAAMRWPLWLLALAGVVGVVGVGSVFWISTHRVREVGAIISTPTGLMMLVPAGRTLIGKDHHKAETGRYYIDRTEVSNESYRGFASAAGRPLPENAMELPATFPIVNVSYEDASAFCTWAGKRLPTDLEWEKAARGPDGLPYPWGSEARANLANIPFREEPHQIEPVESNLAGASLYGAINLVGNVWEWVAKVEPLEESDIRGMVLDPPVERNEAAYQIRGGSYLQRIELNQAVWDFAVAPARLKRPDIGFRCARGY